MALITPGPAVKPGPFGLAADWLPPCLHLESDVAVQVASETDDVTKHLVGNVVREEPAHVGELTGMLDQRREHVVLQAGGRALDPAQLRRRRQQLRRHLAEERVGVGDLRHGVLRSLGVGDGHRAGRLLDLGQAFGVDGRVNDQLHERFVLLFVSLDRCEAAETTILCTDRAASERVSARANGGCRSRPGCRRDSRLPAGRPTGQSCRSIQWLRHAGPLHC